MLTKRKMLILTLFGIFLTWEANLVEGLSVDSFLKSYAGAPNNAVRKVIIEDMLGDLNSKPIEEIFDGYEQTPDESQTANLLKNRDFLKKEDREYLDHALKYTKIANSKWGQILLHPERITNPVSVLEWDMKTLVKKVMMNQKLREMILQRVFKNKKFVKTVKTQLKESVKDPAAFKMVEVLLHKMEKSSEFVDTAFWSENATATDYNICVDQLTATYGYPIDVVLHYIELIVVQILQTIFSEVDGLCLTLPGNPGSVIQPIVTQLCYALDFPEQLCDTLNNPLLFTLACDALGLLVLAYEPEPLREQPTLIQTVASNVVLWYN